LVKTSFVFEYFSMQVQASLKASKQVDLNILFRNSVRRKPQKNFNLNQLI